MADQGGDQDRSEAATPSKLEEARKKGMVFKSPEVVSVVCLTAGIIALAAFGDWSARQTLIVDRRLMAGAASWGGDASQVLSLLARVSETGLWILSPLLALVCIAAVLGNFVQTGPVFSTHPLKPDFTRLNPATGLKRLFSVRALFEAGKSLVKFGIYVLVGYLLFLSIIPKLASVYHLSPLNQAGRFGSDLLNLLRYLLVAALVIAAADWVFSRWEYARRMRMSRREVKDEVRRREGDPMLRSKRREIQRELRKRSASVSKVKDADVLVTNPEHFAVALRYRRGQAPAPEVIAKGTDDLALAMRQAAFYHRVPIIPNPRLARALFREAALNRPIPESHYPAVADVLRWVYALRHRRERQVAA